MSGSAPWKNDQLEHKMEPEAIRDMIEASLEDCQAHVEGDGTHFTAIVVCPGFVGKTRIQKQQMVYDTVREHLLDGSLHALSIKAFTPDEWEAMDDGQDDLNEA